MPDEPNKKMDELLRAYADQRRKQPEPELHPATRKMLQGEVARVFGKAPEPQPRWSRLRSFWPHIAFAGGLCLVFGIAILSLRQPARLNESATPERPVEAKEENANAPTPEAQPSPEPAKSTTAAQENESLHQSLPARERVAPQRTPLPPRSKDLRSEEAVKLKAEEPEARFFRAPADSAAAPAPVAADSSRQEATLGAPVIQQETALSTSTPAHSKSSARRASSTLPAPGLGVSAEKLTRAAEITNLGAARRLNFVQVSSPAVRNAVVAPPTTTSSVLTSFQLEQMGTNVRLLDRDGSVYVGNIEPTNIALFAGGRLAPADQPVLDNSAAYFFRVQGTNKTLGSGLVLIGNYFAETNTAPSSLDTFAIAPEAKQQQNQTRHLIIGNATIGSTNQVPVQAIATEP